MPLIIGFSTTWERSMSTLPSLVTSKERIVPVLSPAEAVTSKSSSTRVPSTSTSNLRWPACAVHEHRLAK